MGTRNKGLASGLLSPRIRGFLAANAQIPDTHITLGHRAQLLQNLKYVMLIAVVLAAFATNVSVASDIERSITLVPGSLATLAISLNYIFYRITRRARLAATISVLIGFLLLAYTVVSGLDGGRLMLWIYFYLAWAVVLTGVKEATLWITALLIIFFTVNIWGEEFLNLQSDYSSYTLEVFAVTTAFIMILLYFYDKSIMSYVSILKEDRMRTERRNAQYSTLLGSIGDGLIAINEDYQVQFLNNSATSMLGINSIAALELVIGSKISDTIPVIDEDGNTVPLEKQPIHHVINTGRRVDTNDTLGGYKFLRRDGGSFPVAIVASPIKVGGSITGAVIVFRDTTWQQQIDISKNEFVSLASHQLRTPLTTINWYTEMLLDNGGLNDEQKQLVEAVSAGSRNMTELVGALLNTSRLELGTLVMEQSIINIAQLLESTIESNEPATSSKKIKLTHDIQDKDLVISGDPQFIGMVFDNLISNAIKYTPDEGTITIKSIGVSKGSKYHGTTFKHDGVFLKFTDTGMGIPERQQNQVFTKMFRADNVRTSDVQGTGLGLYMTRMILEQCSGRIWFESETDKGTTFFVFIPYDNNHQKKERK